ncbi:hypothetical protein ED733_003990 [Metarhizium rileyi]|uniref:Hydroxynaphthalene reductase-like protein Arp2 n=1 Tax=Metarhizium rileyi (strain RCEF 4871) TaxID=1649241 RepID=A0A5C6GN90_METRR|nr:hypothetical protein ED733_003990 [Metarhizium rileyi]
MSAHKGAFQPPKAAQTHNQPGFEHQLDPTSESTRLEGKEQLHEYKAADKLSGSNALITGGDSGIGRSVAVLFAREGANVSIVYLPDEQQDAEETKKMVEKEGRQCVLIAGNLMENETCKSAVEQHVNKFGKIDVLVNNAASQVQCDNLEEINLSTVEKTFRTNILQIFAVTKYALKHMERGGSIINSTSTVAYRGTANFVDYAATKGAISSFTQSLAKQLMPRGIRVNAVAPGPVHTPIQAASRPPEQMKDFGKNSQLGRPGQPSEIAPSYVFLASKDAELFYGQVLHAYPLGD